MIEYANKSHKRQDDISGNEGEVRTCEEREEANKRSRERNKAEGG
jgi:hypothetical protein